MFHKLSDEDIRKIARLMLTDVAKRVGELGISLSFTDEVVAELAKEGFDEVYGARPLRRAIQRKIEDGLSVELLESRIAKGDRVTASLEDGKIVYRVTGKEEAVRV